MYNLKFNETCTEENLNAVGFKKYGTGYKLTVPLYKSNKSDIISVTFLILPKENYIGYDVLDNNTNTLYYAYYDRNNNQDNNLVLHKSIIKLNEVINKLIENRIITNEVEIHE